MPVPSRSIQDPIDPEELAQVRNRLARSEAIGRAAQRIHEGITWLASDIEVALADATSIKLLIRTPADLEVHMAIGFAVVGDFTYQFFEAPTTSADGAALTPVNRNRRFGTSSNTLVFRDPTVSANGTLLRELAFPGGQRNNATLGGGSGTEWILKPSTDYLIDLLNLSGSASLASVEVNYYEVTDGGVFPTVRVIQ